MVKENNIQLHSGNRGNKGSVKPKMIVLRDLLITISGSNADGFFHGNSPPQLNANEELV